MTINPKHMPMYEKYYDLGWIVDPVLMFGNQTTANFEEFDLARDFFASLGVKDYTALDLDEGDLKLNLNDPQPSIYQKYQTVINIGTLEHVWDAHMAWSNALSAVKIGGMFLSVSPSIGWRNHGMHHTVPKWIAHFIELNGFNVKDSFPMPDLPDNKQMFVIAAKKIVHVSEFIKPMEVRGVEIDGTNKT